MLTPAIASRAAAARRRWRLPAAGWRLAVLGAWLLPVVLFVTAGPWLIDPDAYFHLQLAAALREHGLWLQHFPWATESVWTDGWFDKEWLFHVLLVPLLALGKPAAAKVMVIIGNLLVIIGLWSCCRALRLSPRATAFWLVLLPWGAWGIFWVRLSVCRPQLFSVALLFLALAALLRRQHVWLGVLSLLYAWCYTGHWQLLGLVALYDVAYAVLDEDGRRRPALATGWPLLVAAATGMLLGEALHPHFPRHLYGLFVQNILVLADAWTQAPADFRPAELRAAGGQLLWLAAPLFFGLTLVAVQTLRRRARWSRATLLFASYSLGYLVLAAKSFRFLEYAVPMTVVFLGVFFARQPLPLVIRRRLPRVTGLALLLVLSVGCWWWAEIDLDALRWTVPFLAVALGLEWLPRLRHRLNPLLPAALLWLAVYGGTGYREYYVRYNGKDPTTPTRQVPYAVEGAWLQAHVPAGAIVFATDWAANPILWYHAPRLRYLVFLDPVFMRQRSPARFAGWEQIRRGAHPDPVTAIREQFGARVVWLRAADTALRRQLASGGATLAVTGAAGDEVWRLPAGGAGPAPPAE